MKGVLCGLVLTLTALCVGCADVSTIEDGKKYGAVTVLQDWFTSCQLVKTKNAVLLFDACFREETLRASLQKQGLKPTDVTHVIFTHGHGDHVGGLGILTNAKVLAMAAEQDNLTKNAGENGKIDQILKDGEVLTFDDTTIKVLAVPGHTKGSAVYLVGGTLILGDSSLFRQDGSLSPPAEDRSEDVNLAVKSLVDLDARLTREKLEVKWLLPAHSGGQAGQSPLTTFANAQNSK